MRVLVIDDSVSMRQMISIVLRGAGHEPVEAIDGQDGISKLDSSFDVVITDFNMPNMTGVEFIRTVREGTDQRSVPILMLTTESEIEKKMEGRKAGATAWITKPFNKELLLSTLDKITKKVQF